MTQVSANIDFQSSVFFTIMNYYHKMAFNDKGRCYVVSFTALVFWFFFHSCLLTIIWHVGCWVFFLRICGPTINVSKHWRKVWTGWSRKEQVGVLLVFVCWFVFFQLLHYGKHQYCIHVSAVCFSNVCSNGRSTSLLAFVALTAFKNKCPATARRGRRTSNLFLLLTDERARPYGRAQILRKGRRNGKAPVQSARLWWQSQVCCFVLQAGTHTLSALNSVSFLYNLLSALQCIW